MHQNSLFAYRTIEDKLSERQKAVLSVFDEESEYTAQEIKEILGWEINQVTGRITELRDVKKKIEEAGNIYVNGRPRMKYRLTH